MEVDRSLLLGDDQLEQLVISLLNSSEQCPDDLLDAEPHPNDRTLVTFADRIYTKKNPGESAANYGERTLSGELYDNGWRCLITANNATTSNGYFGATFYHSGQQQVVVAHRGTVPECFGAWYTDLIGVVGTEYTPCMNSAVTFIDNIRKVIHSANSQHNRHYTLTITGHSLGAWLAQITAFSVKYLAIERLDSLILFKKNSGIHAKTVGFDSPGARNMLNQIRDKYYFRHAMNRPNFKGLDITLYLSAPNHINTCGEHLGRIYRVFNNESNFIRFDLCHIRYTYETHKISNFVVAFEDGNIQIGLVLDWAKKIKEFNRLFDILVWDNNYHAYARADDPILQPILDRYQVVERESPENEDNIGSFRVFSEVELQMLYNLHTLQKQNRTLTILNNFIINNNLRVGNTALFPDFEIIDHREQAIRCESRELLAVLCRHLKQLMRWLKPEFTQAVEEQIKAFGFINYAQGQSYLDSLPRCWLNFSDSVGFQDFLISRDHYVLRLVTRSEGGPFQMTELRNILHQMETSPNFFSSSINRNLYTFVGWPHLKTLTHNFYGWPTRKEYVIVVDCTSSSITNEDLTALIDKIRLNFMKLVLIVSESIDTPDSSKFVKTVNSYVRFSDLTLDSQNKGFERENVIKTGNGSYSLQQFLGDNSSVGKINQILSLECFQFFATVKDYLIDIKDTRPTLSDIQIPPFKLNIKTSMEFFASCMKSPDTNILVMSGLNREDLETGADWHQLKGLDIILAEGDAQLSFGDTCNKNQDKCVYLFEVLGRDVYCKEVFNRRFYLDRKFLHRAYIDIKNFAEYEHAHDLFVFSNEEDKCSLKEKGLFVKGLFDNVLFAATEEEEMNIIQKYINKRIHFVKICQSKESYKLEWRYSHGSVESLLSCTSVDHSEPIDVSTLSKTERNLVIIIEEPGTETSLARLARLVKSPWVIYIDLKNFQRHIRDKLPQVLDAQSVASFLLSECCTRMDDGPVQGLLEYFLQSKMLSKRVVIFLVGCDELDDCHKGKESAKEKIFQLLIFLTNIPTVQIFFSGCEISTNILKEKINYFSTSFAPIKLVEQQSFLVEFWRSCLSLELGVYREEEEGRLEKYAREMIQTAKLKLGLDMDCFMGVSLKLRMLAEVFRPQSHLLRQSPELLLEQINIVSAPNLYKLYVDLKYQIYLEEKSSGDDDDKEEINLYLKHVKATHGKLAFRLIFPEFYNQNFDPIRDRWLNQLNRFGLIQTTRDGGFHFVHHTFAEYCCAQMIVLWLDQQTFHCRYELFKDICVRQILLHPDKKIIRMFLNELLNETTMSKKAPELNSKCISKLWKEDSSIFRNERHQTVLHIAVEENNEHIATLLLRGLKIESEQEAFVSLIIQYDHTHNTAINYLNKPKVRDICEGELILDTMTKNILQHIATCSDENKANILYAILFNRKVSESDETAEKFFFERFFNRHGIKASRVSTKKETIIIINLFYREINKYISYTERIFDRVKEVELVIKPFIEAVKNNNVKQVQNILFEKLKNNAERYCFLLMKHKDELMRTVLHIAIYWCHLDIVRILEEQTAVPFPVLMAQRDGAQYTPLHRAVSGRGGLDITKYLVERGADINTRGVGGVSVLMFAALEGELLTVKYLVEKGADIHATDVVGQTVLHYAAWGGDLPVVEYFLQQGLDPNRVDRDGETALTRASEFKNWDVVRLLLERGVDINADGGKALRQAIRRGEWSIVEAFINKGAAIKERQIKHNLSEFKVKYPNYEFKKE